MTIVIKDKDGVRYPFGEPKTPEQEIEELKKELEERDEQLEVLEGAITEIAKMMLE